VLPVLALAAGALAALAGCAGPGPEAAAALPASVDVPVTRAPAEAVHANWKERIDEAYAFLEHQGDYRSIGTTMLALFARLDAAGVEPTGAPFALFFDDPGRVPLGELRARACVPVDSGDAGVRVPEGVSVEVLPRSTVVYAVVAGAYAEVPRAYPALFAFLREHGWNASGPVREVYLNAANARSAQELLTEVQIPWTFGR